MLAHSVIRTIVALVDWEFEMLDTPDELGGYAGPDGPVRAFVRLRKIIHYIGTR